MYHRQSQAYLTVDARDQDAVPKFSPIADSQMQTHSPPSRSASVEADDTEWPGAVGR